MAPSPQITRPGTIQVTTILRVRRADGEDSPAIEPMEAAAIDHSERRLLGRSGHRRLRRQITQPAIPTGTRSRQHERVADNGDFDSSLRHFQYLRLCHRRPKQPHGWRQGNSHQSDERPRAPVRPRLSGLLIHPVNIAGPVTARERGGCHAIREVSLMSSSPASRAQSGAAFACAESQRTFS